MAEFRQVYLFLPIDDVEIKFCFPEQSRYSRWFLEFLIKLGNAPFNDVCACLLSFSSRTQNGLPHTWLDAFAERCVLISWGKRFESLQSDYRLSRLNDTAILW